MERENILPDICPFVNYKLKSKVKGKIPDNEKEYVASPINKSSKPSDDAYNLRCCSIGAGWLKYPCNLKEDAVHCKYYAGYYIVRDLPSICPLFNYNIGCILNKFSNKYLKKLYGIFWNKLDYEIACDDTSHILRNLPCYLECQIFSFWFWNRNIGGRKG